MFRIAFLCFLLSASNCFSQSDADMIARNRKALEIVIPSAKDEPGIGKNEGAIDTDPFQLPPGIRFVERPGYPFNPDLSKLHGISNAFYVAVHLVNDNIKLPGDSIAVGAPVQITFEPALVMLSANPSKFQNGMFMDRIRITIPPTGIGPGGIKEKQDTVTIYLAVSCMNKDWAVPWEDNPGRSDDVKDYPIAPNGMYTITGYAKHKGLKQLIALLQHYPKLKLTKHYSLQQTTDPHVPHPEWLEIYDMIQEMVWKVTDGPGIMRGELELYKEKLEPYK